MFFKLTLKCYDNPIVKPFRPEELRQVPSLNAFPFTTSMKRFDDSLSLDVEEFYVIHNSMVTFNTNLVESISFLSPQNSQVFGVRLNNVDGTTLDRLFSVIDGRISELESSPEKYLS